MAQCFDTCRPAKSLGRSCVIFGKGCDLVITHMGEANGAYGLQTSHYAGCQLSVPIGRTNSHINVSWNLFIQE